MFFVVVSPVSSPGLTKNRPQKMVRRTKKKQLNLWLWMDSMLKCVENPHENFCGFSTSNFEVVKCLHRAAASADPTRNPPAEPLISPRKTERIEAQGGNELIETRKVTAELLKYLRPFQIKAVLILCICFMLLNRAFESCHIMALSSTQINVSRITPVLP